MGFSMKRARIVGIQYAALPYRVENGRLRILLISSRRTRRWVIPKGWPIAGRAPHEGASMEAIEEAGVIGEISEQSLGSYRYLKDDENLAIQVLVFPLRVDAEVASFKEQGQRIATWFPVRRAAHLVAEPSLRRLILDFGDARSTNVFVRGLRRYRAWRFGTPAGDLSI
jgi:8-oxo-dGTP pyrophosphatase MutT (NUDIX family)